MTNGTTTTEPTRDEKFQAINRYAEQHEMESLILVLDYAAQVWNGGHEQWLDNGRGKDLPSVPELINAFTGRFASAAAGLATAALQARYIADEHGADDFDLLDALDSAFYGGVDTILVDALYGWMVSGVARSGDDESGAIAVWRAESDDAADVSKEEAIRDLFGVVAARVLRQPAYADLSALSVAAAVVERATEPEYAVQHSEVAALVAEENRDDMLALAVEVVEYVRAIEG